MLTNQKKIQHLYWRAGFGISMKELKRKQDLPLNEISDKLFLKAKQVTLLDIPFDDEETYKKVTPNRKLKLLKAKKARLKVKELNATWVQQMAANPLLERMTLFWHGHFACITKKKPRYAKNQNNTIRQHALGNFRDMLIAISKDPAMIRFLNNQQNKKNKPNENYARELLELFTLGQGNYTEKDIKEAARAFTGWHSNETDFVFKEKHHDFNSKTFFGKTGNFDGDDIIDIILEQKQTARFIATKVYKYFVNENVNKTHINILADAFYNSNYNIETLMRTVFESDWFYNPENIGTKIKSPIDLLVGLMNTAEINFDEEGVSIFFIEKILGQILFNPPNVAGWPRGKSWIDNASLMVRLNLANYIINNSELDVKVKQTLEGEKIKKAKIKSTMNVSSFYKEFEGKEDSVIFEELANWLVQPKLVVSEKTIMSSAKELDKKATIILLIKRLSSLPEYQLC